MAGCSLKGGFMEYSKDIILGVQYLRGEDKLNSKTKKEKLLNKKHVKGKNRILKFMNEHKFITSISVMCTLLIMLDFVLVYSFVELLKGL